MAASASGDEAAFSRLVRRHAPKAEVVALRFLGSRADAEDVVQDAFARAWSSAARWRPGEAAFGTWMHRVVVNLCIDRSRRSKLRRWLSLESAPDVANDDIGVDRTFEGKQDLRAVLADIQKLPERQRAAILLAAAGGRSNAEIARELGASEKALEALLVRARRTLRAELRAREGDGS